MRRFRLSETPIDAGAQRLSLEDPAAGGCVTFEGWVRNHNEARAVTRLDYQAYVPLAEDEGEAILAEATTKFALRAVRCVHRTGSLVPGELAVVIAVAAPHRAEAFDACRHLIERLKEDVPIWKREFSDDGEEWVGVGP